IVDFQPSRCCDIVQELVIANRILANEGVIDGFGHISARHPDDPDRYLMACSRAPEFVETEDILTYDLDSRPIDAGDRAIHAERFIHGEIYKARPDVMSVCHTHA
ncbi:MAG: class II aldolase/adducin family protein, partial [Rickettsiales bacterium]